MRKLLCFVLCFWNVIIADTTTYELLSTVHPDKILVREIKQIPISGFDSRGHMITLYQTVTNEKSLDLYEAFDIGIRYYNSAIVLESLAKLEKLHATIDVSDSIVVICNAIKNESSTRLFGNIAAGIIAGCSIFPWFVEDGGWHVYYDRFGYRYYEYYGLTTGAKVFTSAILFGTGALLWFASRSASRARIKELGDVLCVLFTSPACFIYDRQKVRAAITNIADRLDCLARAQLFQYLVLC